MRMISWMMLVAACVLGGCSAAGPIGSCSGSSTPICVDLVAGFSNPSAYCGAAGLSFSTGLCPASGRVGRCTLTGRDDSGEMVTYTNDFYGPTYTALSVRQQCPPPMPVSGVTYEYSEN